MFSFFSPTKPGQESDENAADLEPKSVATKRPRSESSPAKTETNAANSTDKMESVDQKKATPVKPKARGRPKGKAKGKPKASPKAKAKPRKKRQPVRFVSPHAAMNSEDEDEDLDDDEDVFNTPEAKRARAELESGGDIVPAGAPISDDAIVDDSDVVDVSGNAITTETVADAQDTVEEAEAKESAAAGNVVDLTTAKTTSESTKTRGRTAAARSNKTAAKTPTKRQQKMKEKVAEAKPVPVEPLDPAIQARVDTYKLKTDELTRQYTELLQSEQESDVIMQEIYGAGLDRDLDVTVDHDKAQQALAETWQKLRDHAHASSTADAVVLPSSVEFPHEVKCLIVKGIQGKTMSLSAITSQLLALFKKDLEAEDVDMEATEITSSSDSEKLDNTAILAMEMEIKMLAQRTLYGVKPAKANIFEDTSVDALWVWEVGNLDKYFQDAAQKTIKRMRKNRKRLGQQLKALARVIQLLHQKPVDEAKVSAEEAKIGKFGFAVDTELQKAKTRETKVQEKRSATEEKKRHEKERQQAKEAKDEEKRKREREEQEQKAATSKKFKAFFESSKANDAGSWSSRRHRDSKLGVMKLLQFYENSRPAYYGTYSTRSPVFRGGRRPLAQFAKFDYSVDSDDEWEEEEPGESLSDDDNDGEESDEDNLDYGDQWLAYEDEVDYMDGVDAEDDTMEHGEGPSSPTKHKLPSQLQKKRVKAKAVKPAKLETQILGPFWCLEESKDCTDHLSGLAGELLCEPVFESTMMRKAREYEEEQKRLEAVRLEQQRKKDQLQEQEKAKKKKVEQAKQKTETAACTEKQAGTAKNTTSQKATPQKPKTQKSPAKTPITSPSTTKTTSATSPSPAKPSGSQIDSFFKKMTGPVLVPPKPQQPKPQPEDNGKTKDGSVEIISVD
ncbi:Chromatin assembly factor 1 subunit A [Phytophthora nicotianae]|uniref:Chromatin assembly factor 1 subunit A n=1 Tax=Phytophthora nicotianae TaxID=4792 RepID=A0A0W8D4T7_PHYNI|nr:Chromatin assembly factor 1 subunit A [Phytophthora nicotianae]